MLTVIRAAALIDGTGRPPARDVTVVVEDGRIAALRDPGAAPVTAPHRLIEVPGGTVLPGLIDAHVHLFHHADPAPWRRFLEEPEALTMARGIHNAGATLRAGFTSVRVTGSRAALDLVLERAIAEGLVPGPRIVGAGQTICATGGHGHLHGLEADGPDAVRRAVRLNLKRGARVIKLTVTAGIATPGRRLPGTPQLQEAEIRAAVEEAEQAGVRVCVHAQGRVGVRRALAAGVHSIEHGYFLDDAASLAHMVERGVYLVPTLVAYALVLEKAEAGIPAEAVAKARYAIEAHRESYRLAVRAGVPIAMGSDAGTEFNVHGDNAREFAFMVEHGLGPMDAIVAGTRNGARLLGLDQEVGTLEAGKLADLIAVADDPLARIEALGRPCLVVKAGEVVRADPPVRLGGAG
jgi:imidazolonepropionase-like amidohydrolase